MVKGCPVANCGNANKLNITAYMNFNGNQRLGIYASIKFIKLNKLTFHCLQKVSGCDIHFKAKTYTFQFRYII